MDRQKKPQISPAQAREELGAAKERLAGQAKELSVKDFAAGHPYASLGVAFASGAVLGGSHEARVGVARTLLDVIVDEIARYRNRH